MTGAVTGTPWCMRGKVAVGAAIGLALGVRLLRARRERALHPRGRSYAAEVELWGVPGPGADLLGMTGRFPATVRISKGAGTPAGWPDVLGVGIRVETGDGPRDLLLSSTGTGRVSRHLPVPRRSFDTRYGAILAYRTARAAGGRVYLDAVGEPGATPLGPTLATVEGAAATGDARLLLRVDDGHGARPFGRVVLGAALSPEDDAALAFNPVRHTAPGLRPAGLVHASRAWAYRLSQRWRDADADRQPDTAGDGSTARPGLPARP